jgi:DivIVA domain-containing protein
VPDQSPTSSSIGHPLSPDDIVNHVFPTARKGLNPDAVNQFLVEVAKQVRELKNEVRAASFVQRPAPAPAPAPELDEAGLTKALGEEITRVLQTAKDSAHSVVSSAENQAAELVAGAQSMAQQRRSDAEDLSRSMQERAERDAKELVEKTKTECRSMIEEAREARRRVLADLGERRRVLLVQLEQVRVGRESMVSAIDAVASNVVRSIEEVRLQLGGAEESARIAAEHAAKELDERLLDGSEEVDALVEEALAKLPQVGEGAVFTSFEGTIAHVVEGRVFDIEREQEGRPVISVSVPTVVSSELKVTGPISTEATAPNGSRAKETAPPRRPDASPTVGQVVTPPVVTEEPTTAQNDEAVGENSPVDQLFAKIRASRQSNVADAQRVLDSDAGKDSALTHKVVEKNKVNDVTEESSQTGAVPAQEARSEQDSSEEKPNGRPPVEQNVTETVQDTSQNNGLLQRRDALLEHGKIELSRALKRVLLEEQNLLLDGLRNLKKNDKIASLLLGDAARSRLVAEISPSIKTSHAAAAEFLSDASRRARKSTFSSEESVSIAERLASEVIGVLNARLSPTFNGDGTGDAVEAVGSAFRDWKAQRVESLASDYVTTAFGEGAVAYAISKKISLVWNVDDAGSNCPDCDDNSVAGSVQAGQAFPTGHVNPPVHPGCRCFLSL